MKRVDPIGRTVSNGVAGNYDITPRNCQCIDANLTTARGAIGTDTCARCSCQCGSSTAATTASS